MDVYFFEHVLVRKNPQMMSRGKKGEHGPRLWNPQFSLDKAANWGLYSILFWDERVDCSVKSLGLKPAERFFATFDWVQHLRSRSLASNESEGPSSENIDWLSISLPLSLSIYMCMYTSTRSRCTNTILDVGTLTEWQDGDHQYSKINLFGSEFTSVCIISKSHLERSFIFLS